MLPVSVDTGPPHTYWRVSADGIVQELQDGAQFYEGLFAEAALWSVAGVRANATTFVLPGQEGARQVDTLWASLVAALSLYVGPQVRVDCFASVMQTRLFPRKRGRWGVLCKNIYQA